MKIRNVLLLLIIPVFSFSQTMNNNGAPPADEDSFKSVPTDIIDGAFTKDHNQKKKEAFKYPTIREKDIVWSKTVWREIDLKQKMNHHFYYPAVLLRYHLNPDKMSLIDVIMEAIQGYTYTKKCETCQGSGFNPSTSTTLSPGGSSGECPRCLGTKSHLRVFETGFNPLPGNEFKYGLLTDDEKKVLGDDEPLTEWLVDAYNQPIKDTNLLLSDGSINKNYGKDAFIMTPGDSWDRRKVIAWKLKEEWFFDKKRSVMDVRIVGLAPCILKTNPVTRVEELLPVFWIYYPDFRDVMLNTKVANYTKNNAQERSYLGIFEKRMFSTRITMESNIMNREISDYMIGLDALLESDRIQEGMFNIEHDLWEY
ncbi:MAG: type IX secretion system ring subunit PorN/GldN [Flavobacteriales bacterium]